MELEWNWNGVGMEFEWTGNGVGMELEHWQKKNPMDGIKDQEWKWNRNGMNDLNRIFRRRVCLASRFGF